MNVTDFGSTLRNHPDDHGKLYRTLTQVRPHHLPKRLLPQQQLRRPQPNRQRARAQAAAGRLFPRLRVQARRYPRLTRHQNELGALRRAVQRLRRPPAQHPLPAHLGLRRRSRHPTRRQRPPQNHRLAGQLRSAPNHHRPLPHGQEPQSQNRRRPDDPAPRKYPPLTQTEKETSSPSSATTAPTAETGQTSLES